MKCLLFIAVFFSSSGAFGQAAKQDLTKAFSSADRTAILETLKQKLQPDLKCKPRLVVSKLTMKDGFAYFIGRAKDPAGKDIDFSKTVYKEYVKEGIFDGDGTNALLKKTGGKWRVMAYVIGPTDVPWGCWWKEYKAPREIFDYVEKNCNWVK